MGPENVFSSMSSASSFDRAQRDVGMVEFKRLSDTYKPRIALFVANEGIVPLS
jgi:hypothetical protein